MAVPTGSLIFISPEKIKEVTSKIDTRAIIANDKEDLNWPTHGLNYGENLQVSNSFSRAQEYENEMRFCKTFISNS